MDLPGVEVPDGDAEGSACRATAGRGIPRAGCGCGCLRPLCEWDRCGHLTGRQKRFASDACKNAFHDLHRPRIASAVVGHPREGTIKAAVLACLVDARWWSYHDLAAACKADKHSVVSRVSELHRAGHRIEYDLKRGNSRRPHRVRLQP